LHPVRITVTQVIQKLLPLVLYLPYDWGVMTGITCHMSDCQQCEVQTQLKLLLQIRKNYAVQGINVTCNEPYL